MKRKLLLKMAARSRGLAAQPNSRTQNKKVLAIFIEQFAHN